MLAIELLALVLLLGVLAIGIKLAWAAVRGAGERAQERRRRQRDMESDLRAALAARDHRCLDDFIVVWGSTVDKQTLDHVKGRRDELYVDGPGGSP